MAKICSRHIEADPDCAACNIPDDDPFMLMLEESRKKSEAAGKHTCECGFVYYKVVDSCPLCNRVRNE
jgi:hypothetical protein